MRALEHIAPPLRTLIIMPTGCMQLNNSARLRTATVTLELTQKNKTKPETQKCTDGEDRQLRFSGCHEPSENPVSSLSCAFPCICYI